MKPENCKFSDTLDDPLSTLRIFFALWRKYSLRLHARKCSSSETEVHWCGRRIFGEGVTFDLRNLQSLTDVSHPTLPSELQQFLCAFNWILQCIAGYTKLIHPLQTLFESACSQTKRRTKRAIQRIKFCFLGWDTSPAVMFDAIKNSSEACCDSRPSQL